MHCCDTNSVSDCMHHSAFQSPFEMTGVYRSFVTLKYKTYQANCTKFEWDTKTAFATLASSYRNLQHAQHSAVHYSVMSLSSQSYSTM